MKKKLLTAFLVTALGISMLSGCGGKNSDDNSTKSEQSTKEKDQETEYIFLFPCSVSVINDSS